MYMAKQKQIHEKENKLVVTSREREGKREGKIWV